MTRYIDADALLESIPQKYVGFRYAVTNAPTADVVDVVRCKDCKHRPYTDDDGDVYAHSWDDKTCPCTCEDSYYNWMPEDDFFCKRGERKE